jgi:uncharacterized membrane protein YgdD (TMEM256/DUF423 family)
MNKRPVTVTIVGCLLVVVGAAGFAYHLHEVTPQHALQGGNVWIFVREVAVIVCGVSVLRGNNWARWLALAWITFHAVFSFFDSSGKMAIHSLILLFFAYFLFRSEANTYFRQRETKDV